MTSPPASSAVTVRRLPDRSTYDAEVRDAILDEGLVAHVGLVDDEGRPVVIPMAYARDHDHLLLHGSPASRLLRGGKAGIDLCVTVTLLDGLVLARSAFHHSMNYRSAVLFGTARLVKDPDEKLRALEAVVEHVVPGRSRDARPPNDFELKYTQVLEFRIDEASAKLRTGGPKDDAEDMELPIWAGVIPLRVEPQAPVPDPATREELPGYVTSYRRVAAD